MFQNMLLAQVSLLKRFVAFTADKDSILFQHGNLRALLCMFLVSSFEVTFGFPGRSKGLFGRNKFIFQDNFLLRHSFVTERSRVLRFLLLRLLILQGGVHFVVGFRFHCDFGHSGGCFSSQVVKKKRNMFLNMINITKP
uniref:(northern house mosquito) hypothetical protein n=1 Tax=Culex pipiens TaxID=7175 RepID=A0A8D8GJQ1_CULPI